MINMITFPSLYFTYEIQSVGIGFLSYPLLQMYVEAKYS